MRSILKSSWHSLEADEDIKEKIAKEISRFKNVGQNNSEGAVCPRLY